MSERAYTVSEIDRMRLCVARRQYIPNWKDWEFQENVAIYVRDRLYANPKYVNVIEEMLRTYMLAGIAPEDLE